MILNDIDNAYVGGEEVDKIYLGEDIIWEKSGPTPPTPVPYEQQYLTIEALEDGDLNVNSESLEYSINDGEWIHAATTPTVLPLQNGDKVRFRSNANHSFTGLFTGNTISFNVYGNIESLEYGDNFSGTTSVRSPSAFTSCFRDCSGLTDASNLVLPATALANYCYNQMFRGCTNLTHAPELPAETLAIYCYNGMFRGCTNLTHVPELPAETLAIWCYYNMFQGCTSLTQAPELPATTLAEQCYRSMFQDCRSLNYIKCLATDISATFCTNNWVNGVASSGTFVKNPNKSDWTTGSNGIPTNWTVVDNVSQ